MAFLADEAFAYLERSHRQHRLAHAYLITGPEGAGKQILALQLLQLLNGVNAQRLEEVRDPHFHLIRPESRSRRIRIDQIRALERNLHLSGRPGLTKLGVVMNADRLQTESANAFLKTLEEPPRSSVLLLLTDQPEQLLETVRSRCIRVPLYARETQRREDPAMTGFLESVGEHLAGDRRTLSRAMLLARAFSTILKAEKDEIARANDAALKEEISRYQETTDGDWLKRREVFYKDLTESEYVQTRTALVEQLMSFLGDALRQQIGYDRVDYQNWMPVTRKIAQQLPPHDLERRVQAIEAMRGHLETTALASLVIDVGFIRAFA